MRNLLTGIQHIGLPTKHFNASCNFYQKIGFDPVYETKQANGRRVAFYQLGNLQIEIYEAEETTDKDGALDHIAINCIDIDKAYNAAKNRGLHIISDGIEELNYWDKGIKFFHVKGPAGEKIEFCQRL